MSFATSTNPNSPPARLRLALRQPEPPHEPYIRCWYHLSSYSNFFVFFQPLTSDLEHSSNPLFWVLPVLLLGRRRNLVSIDLANSHAGEITAHNVIPHPNPTTSLSLRLAIQRGFQNLEYVSFPFRFLLSIIHPFSVYTLILFIHQIYLHNF